MFGFPATASGNRRKEGGGLRSPLGEITAGEAHQLPGGPGHIRVGSRHLTGQCTWRARAFLKDASPLCGWRRLVHVWHVHTVLVPEGPVLVLQSERASS